jgi:hypothetical protein
MPFHVKFSTAADDYEAVLDRGEAVAWLSLIKWPGSEAIGLGSVSIASLDLEALCTALAAGTASWLEGRTDPFIRFQTPTVAEGGIAMVRVSAVTGVRIWWVDDHDDEADEEPDQDDVAIDDELREGFELPPTPWIQ